MEGAECGLAALVGGVSSRVGVCVCVCVHLCVCYRGGFLAGMGKLDLFIFFKGCRRIGGGGAGFSKSTSPYFISLRWKK